MRVYVIKKNPKHVQAIFDLALIFCNEGKEDQEIKLYKKAMAADPSFAPPYYNLGKTYEDQGKTDLAIKYYEETLKHNPYYIEAAEQLGFILFSQGDLNKATNILFSNIESDPLREETYLNLIKIANSLKDDQLLNNVITEFKKNMPRTAKEHEKESKNRSIKMNNSFQAMFTEAKQQGWIPDNNVVLIPEIMNIYEESSKYFLKTVYDYEPEHWQTLVYHITRYLFVKGVEGVILWGNSPKGEISISFHHEHLFGEIETDLPEHLHQKAVDTMPIGESLYAAHHDFVIKNQSKSDFSLEEEIELVITWIPKFGITYAINNGYDAHRWYMPLKQH